MVAICTVQRIHNGTTCAGRPGIEWCLTDLILYRKAKKACQGSRTPMAIFRTCLLRAAGCELPEVRLIFGERMEYLRRLATILISDLF
jgi:hypothetical protein